MKKDYFYSNSNKNKQLLFLIFIVFCIFSMVFFNHQYFKKRYLIDGSLSINEAFEIKNNRSEYKKNIDLYIGNNKIPYSYLDKFYLLHISEFSDYKKVYTTTEFKIKVVNKESNHSINLLLYNDKHYKEVMLELTNLPVIDINSSDEIKLYGFGNEVYTYNCEYSLRGDSSKNSDKKSYNVKLLNSKNNSIKVSLLGMKENSSWVLNPMYFDNTYVREKISYDIWNNLSSDFKHGLEYAEFVIDDKYQGIYYLEEKVDMATFNGNYYDDLLVSIKDWKYNVDDTVLLSANTIYHNNINEFEIEEGLIHSDDLKLDILKSYSQSLSSVSNSIVPLTYDLTNSVNYGVFINLTSAIDNTYKNQKILFRKKDNHYLVQRTIWDLDWTFANENSSRFEYKLSPKFIYDDQAIPEEIKNNSLYKSLIKEKYFQFRDSYYNLDNLYKLIDKYDEYLNEYGAIRRDSEKWNNLTYDQSLEYLRNYFKERIKVLDEYYGGIDGVS